MVRLIRNHDFGVRIVPLTPELCKRLEQNASRDFNGTRTCSLENMNDSCFASEYCNVSRLPSMSLKDLLKADAAYVALDVGTIPETFVGCVSVARPKSMHRKLFPSEFSTVPCTVVSNLCVSGNYRRTGVGRQLIMHVLANNVPDRTRCYTMIAKASRHHGSSSIDAAFDDRVQRLLRTYNKLDFRRVNECDAAILLRNNCDGGGLPYVLP